MGLGGYQKFENGGSYPCAGTGDVDGAEVLVRYIEHLRKLGPVCHVGLLEDCSGSATLVGVDEILGLQTQREVCEDDISAFLEEEAGKFEVCASYSSACTRPGR